MKWIYLRLNKKFRVLEYLTDESKHKYGVGAGVYIAETETMMSSKFPNDCNIQQAEIPAKKAVKWYHKIYWKDIVITTNSRSTKKSLIDVLTTSNFTNEDL